MKPVAVKSSTYINSTKEINGEDSKFEIGDLVKISKYKNIFTKGYVPNWSEKIFVIKRVKNIVPWIYFISDVKCEKIIGTFYKKGLQKIKQKEFWDEKVINRKGDKLYVKWKGYDSSFDS